MGEKFYQMFLFEGSLKNRLFHLRLNFLILINISINFIQKFIINFGKIVKLIPSIFISGS
ncbi:hypothetical protein BpHYR1_028543 [Brachionus plicatilis]|uniref:Uncharacterized protein n=1 Tax=Brachionus plicatilis TaxID=10195 RepID=A0A3M7R4N0_BRAPC|nr:hypothetical protein BpHYR1_028543 [Brachionus plicatilis]